MAFLPSHPISRIILSTSFIALTAGLGHAAQLEGRVLGGMSETPVEGAQIRIDSVQRTAVSRSDGSFRFENIAAGTYEVRVEYVGTDPLVQTVTIGDDAAPQTFILDEGVDTIIAVGQRANLLSAVNQQRNADNLVSVITSDAMGQFPDQNVTEAARRVSGISVESDQGEGRFIVIRGVDPNLNSTSINGVRLPAPEGDVRGAALDVIDAEVLKGIEVTKTLTADLDGDGIGGNIEIKTVSAFDRNGAYLRAKAAGSYNEQVDAWSPKFSVSASDIYADGKVGIAVTGSYRNRKFGSENQEVDGGFISGDLFPDNRKLYPEEFELRDYQITRERINLAANFDFRPSDDHDFYVRTLYSEFTDDEQRSRVEIKLDEDDNPVQNGDVFTFSEGEVDRDIKDRVETQKIWSLSAGGESRLSGWTAQYSAALTHAEEGEADRLDVEYSYGGDELIADMSDPLTPLITFVDPDYLNASEFEYAGAESIDGLTEDEELAFTLDLRRDTNFGRHSGYIKFGGKVRMRDKNRNEDVIVYDDDDSFTLADTQAAVEYDLFNTLGPVPNVDLVRSFITANVANFDIKADDSFIGSRAADYEASEDIWAGFLMGSVDIDNLKIIGGVRVEHTDYKGEAGDVRLFEEDGDFIASALPMNATCIDKDGISVDPASMVNGAGQLTDDLICGGTATNSDKYTDILPSILTRYEAGENIILRAGYYKSIARPNFGAMVPAVEIESNDDTEFEGSFGNVTSLGIPVLKHQSADSIDVGAEYYTDNGGVISAGLFYKNFNDFIAEFEDDSFVTSFATFEDAIYSINLPSAELIGLELNLQQSLTFLPEGLDGFIFGANFTYIDGNATLSNGQDIPMPKQSDTIANVVVGYDKYGFDLRLAYSYRSEYLDLVSGNTAADVISGRTVAPHDQLDFTAKYKINDNFRLFGEVSNITDEPFLAYETDGSKKVLSQYDEFGRTFEVGLQYKF